LGIGDWGLGIGDWAQSPIPNPQSPIPNPHINKLEKILLNKIYIIMKLYKKYINYIRINKIKENMSLTFQIFFLKVVIEFI